MDRRTIPSLALGVLAVACAVGAFERPAKAPVPQTEALPEGSEHGALIGVIVDKDSLDGIGEAIVILQCSCLENARETMTDAEGLYSFAELPTGKYTVQVLYGRADKSVAVQVVAGFRVRLDVGIAPADAFVRT